MKPIEQFGPGKNFLFSLFNKDGETGCAAAELAEQLRRKKVQLIASGGTKVFLEGLGHKVTDVVEITNQKPVLGHRVVTLSPQLHGGLLAEEEHLEELSSLGWPLIRGVCIDFYDTRAARTKEDADYDYINNAVDIGGPALVRSANKGGRIAIADVFYMKVLTRLLEKDEKLTVLHLRMFQAAASRVVAKYCQFEAEWRDSYFTEQLMIEAGVKGSLFGN